MVEASRRLSPLAGMAEALRHASSPSVQLVEQPCLGQFALRGDPSNGDFVEAVSGALGLAVPVSVGEVAGGADLTVLMLGPDEWLLVRPADADAEPIFRLRTALARRHASLIDLSSGRSAITLSGPKARAVLQKGVTLDLHPRAFGPGRCAQTLMARTPVLLEQIDETPTYRLFVRSSFARHFALWLIEAAREYQPSAC